MTFDWVGGGGMSPGPGIESDRSSGGGPGGGGRWFEVIERSSGGCVLRGTGVRFRSNAPPFRIPCGGGGRLKEDLLTCGC